MFARFVLAFVLALPPFVNGQRVPYVRVNHVFKGVAIPAAGDWDVRFEYRPARWRAALGVGGAGGIVLALIGLAAVGPRRATATPSGARSVQRVATR